MNVATWNVNGIRARAAQVMDWLVSTSPDIVCLQEIKASPEQVPDLLKMLPDYWSCWHGSGGYSGVALLVKRTLCPSEPVWTHPPFDHDQRVVTAVVQSTVYASVYVPNGGKDMGEKFRFLEALREYAGGTHAAGQRLVLCGDLNVARAEIDVHPKERKPRAIGQLPEEREAFARLLDAGLTDVARHLEPDNDALFTWWAPWRNLRQRNIGWRIDYVLASHALVPSIAGCTSHREIGTSDHAPVVATLREPALRT
jgi:exodeoxyribonuclease-3